MRRRYVIPPELRHLRPSQLVDAIRSGAADILPFADAQGRAVIVAGPQIGQGFVDPQGQPLSTLNDC